MENEVLEIKPKNDKADYEKLTRMIDDLMSEIKKTVSDDHAPLKILVFQNIEVGYFWLRKIYEIIEITSVRKPNGPKSGQPQSLA